MATKPQITDAEWSRCTDPMRMLAFLNADPNARKTLWLTAACCRRVWKVLPDYVREWVERVEQVADGRGDADELNIGWERVEVFLGSHDQDGRCYAAINVAGCCWQSWDALEPGSRAWSAERKIQADLVRDIFGNPFRPVSLDLAWLAANDRLVPRLAQTIYNERSLPAGTLDVTRLGILDDALEDAGCTNADILDHCRSPGPHFRGCWVIDQFLSKE